MPTASARKPTNLSIEQSTLLEAKKLGINLSQAAERGIKNEIAERRAELWKQQNKDALTSSNKYVETHGLPLEKARQF